MLTYVGAMMILAIPGGLTPGIVLARTDVAELDVRLIERDEVRRLAYEGGEFPPAAWPVTAGELSALLAAIAENLTDARDQRSLENLRADLAGDAGRGPGTTRATVGGRLLLGHGDLGQPLAHEAGLLWGEGWNATCELSAIATAGSWWAAMTPRLNSRAPDGAASGETNEGVDPTFWPDWRLATGRGQVAAARRAHAAWRWDAPRAVIGATLGRWALSAGWDARRTGPGLTGALLLDHDGASFPAVTARRTRPFRWHGIMAPVSPDQMLIRAGVVSRQSVSFTGLTEIPTRETRPWFFQWLTGWRPTSWSRVTVSHTVMVASREGTLWPDLLQINLPVLGTTWRERDSGPATDRLFAVQTELRWRNAPWPVLPAAAGRVFWDYAGTDFLPSGPGGVVPRISIPASVAGCELFSPSWDLAGEYAELRHDLGLWYTNGGFSDGYSNRGWLLGHPLGGSGESWTGILRVRPGNAITQWGLVGRRSVWGMEGRTPGTGREVELALSVGRPGRTVAARRGTGRPGWSWRVTGIWRRTTADPGAYGAAAAAASVDWWQTCLDLRF